MRIIFYDFVFQITTKELNAKSSKISNGFGLLSYLNSWQRPKKDLSKQRRLLSFFRYYKRGIRDVPNQYLALLPYAQSSPFANTAIKSEGSPQVYAKDSSGLRGLFQKEVRFSWIHISKPLQKLLYK